ncbi:hypothetical protein AMR47_09395 [Leptospira interrogans]|nr:hypothetical protein AMR47_09395 [Leptospira interrogans]
MSLRRSNLYRFLRLFFKKFLKRFYFEKIQSSKERFFTKVERLNSMGIFVKSRIIILNIEFLHKIVVW